MNIYFIDALIATMLIIADKIITLMNIKTVQRNQPSKDALSIEKNPLAKWLFREYGLAVGSILMTFVSAIQFIIAMIFLQWAFNPFVANPFNVAFAIMVTLYGVTLINNTFWLIRYRKVKEK